MTIKSAGGTWQEDVKALHKSIRDERDVKRRMALLARALLGRPYLCDPLGPGNPEKLVLQLQGFDCVTFVESVLALARSRTPGEFMAELVAMRYRGGLVAFEHRLHYFSDWMRENQRRGAIRVRTPGAGSHPLALHLECIAALPVKQIRFHVVPKREFSKAWRRIEDGSVVGFASLRRGLDFFHTGVLFWQESAMPGTRELVMFHAAKSARKVTVEPLIDFLQRNRMRGVAFAAPRNKGETCNER